MPLLLVLAFMFSGLAIYQSYQHDEAVDRFVVRCEEQGGKTLKGANPGHNNWIGCYKGVTEIYNEE